MKRWKCRRSTTPCGRLAANRSIRKVLPRPTVPHRYSPGTASGASLPSSDLSRPNRPVSTGSRHSAACMRSNSGSSASWVGSDSQRCAATPSWYRALGAGEGVSLMQWIRLGREMGAASAMPQRRQPAGHRMFDRAAQIHQAAVEEVAGLGHAHQLGRVLHARRSSRTPPAARPPRRPRPARPATGRSAGSTVSNGQRPAGGAMLISASARRRTALAMLT